MDGMYPGGLDLGITGHFLSFQLGSNLALLDRSELRGHSPALNLRDANFTAETVYAHGGLSTSLVL